MSQTAKPCDSCKSGPASVFCRADSAFLCARCEAEHERHPRVSVCEVCEQAPAAVTCKADDAALCPACDADIHSANPLARRHERFPIAPAEEEAASWLLPDPNSKEFLFTDMDPDLDLVPGEEKKKKKKKKVGYSYSSADGVVPAETDKEYDVDVYPPSKPLMYNFTHSHSVSSSSLEVGVVPEQDAKRVSGMEREARVLRYKEKRKNRRFEKTIRYASRKAYAETRPRIKGRFARRSELQVDTSYGVVPTF